MASICWPLRSCAVWVRVLTSVNIRVFFYDLWVTVGPPLRLPCELSEKNAC